MKVKLIFFLFSNLIILFSNAIQWFILWILQLKNKNRIRSFWDSLVDEIEKYKFEHEKKWDLGKSNNSKHNEFNFFILGTKKLIHIQN